MADPRPRTRLHAPRGAGPDPPKGVRGSATVPPQSAPAGIHEARPAHLSFASAAAARRAAEAAKARGEGTQLSLPLGSRLGAPLGLSLLGPAGSDRSLVRLAERIMT